MAKSQAKSQAKSRTNEVRRAKRVRELEANVKAHVLTWDAFAVAAWNPSTVIHEFASRLEAIENQGQALASATFGDYNYSIGDDRLNEAISYDAENFNMLVEMALAVERELRFFADRVPPQGMEFIRREFGSRLVEMFERLAGNYKSAMTRYANAAQARAIAKGEEGGY
ncbi:MAG TPA: hypothetical protein VFN11_02365 [Ktedonobacterales bacterium]|nr:hypothetical protein [Ktedonobacterales bacterium]